MLSLKTYAPCSFIIIIKFFIFSFFLTAALLPALPVSADETVQFTPEKLISLEAVAETAVSPDGLKIAYIRRVQRSPEDERGAPYTEIFVLHTESDSAIQFTFRPHNAANIVWSPDGRWIYFRSLRSEMFSGMQVYRISSAGGEAELVTEAPSPVLFFRLSPEGNKLAYILQDPVPELVQTRIDAGDDWRVEDEYVRHRRVYVMDFDEDTTYRLTEFDWSVWNFIWSPCGGQLLMQASPYPDTDHMYMFKRLYLADAGGAVEPELFTDTEGKLGGMSFSPDGRHIAWHGAVDIGDPTEGTIFAAFLADRRKWTVTPDFEGTVTWVGWLNDTTLVFTSEEKTETKMSTIDFRGGVPAVLFDKTTAPEFSSAAFAGDSETFVTAASAFNHPNEVFIGNVNEKQIRRLTYHNRALEDIGFRDYIHIEYEARDGLIITGLLLMPADYVEGKKYPLICQIHGGPEAAYTHGWNTSYAAMTQLYSQNGFMVFLPNYRASTGRGVAFAKANYRDGGGREFTDVLDGINYLEQRGLINRNRVGITGGSYGGYFANLAATRYAGNFAAAASWVGISNQFSKTGMTDTPLENILVHFDRAHYQNEHRIGIMESSPIWYLEKAVQKENETPLLILHGETDARVPYGQSVELYNSLKLSYKHHRGMSRDEIPVRFISYPRAGHGTWEVRQQIHFSNTVLEFFKKHLQE